MISQKNFALTGMMMLCFALCIAVFIYLTGDIGFQGDDWWIFGIPYWNGFPESVLVYANESKRPIEGLYWITLYEIFGLYEPAFLAGSLILLALSCLMMSKCLLRAFPDYKQWAIMSGLLSFVITPLGNLVFMLHTDNSRISCLFFWISVWFFQSWAQQPKNNLKLSLPILFYCLATLTYENCSLLIFAVPLLAFPVFKQYDDGKNNSTFRFLVKLFISISVGFSLFLAIRFIVFGGGAVGHKSLTPPLELGISYMWNLAEYMIFPIKSMKCDPEALMWAFLFSFFCLWFLKVYSSGSAEKKDSANGFSTRSNIIWMTMFSFSIIVLGMAPYLLAGYTPDWGLTSQSRIYSSAGFGVAALICLPLTLSNGCSALGTAMRSGILIFAFFSAFALMSLRNDWIQAGIYRDNISRSILTKVPATRNGANFLFKDLQWYLSSNAVVFQGVDGLNEWIKILYKNRNVNAYFMYSPTNEDKDPEKETRISSNGINARGSALQGPLPLDSLILMERQGDKMAIVEKIEKREDRIYAKWEGVDAIYTNMNLIVRE